MAKKPRKKWLDYLLFCLLRLIQFGLCLLPLAWAQKIGSFLGRILGCFDKRHFVRVKEHLRIAFPDWDEQAIHRCAWKSFEHLGLLLVEVLYMPKLIKGDRWKKHVDTGNFELIKEPLDRHDSVIIVTGHIGNWELITFLTIPLEAISRSVARPMDNPYIDKMLIEIREQTNQLIIPKEGALLGLMKALKQRGLVTFVADQNAGKKGLFVDVFGRKASTVSSIAAMALKTGKPIAVITLQRLDEPAKFLFNVEKIIEVEKLQDSSQKEARILELTQEYSTALEQAIVRHPEQWLWAHRRWKTRPPEEVATNDSETAQETMDSAPKIVDSATKP